MRQVIESTAGPSRFALVLFQAFGVAALLLTAIGIYGVVSAGVAERTREIGVRTALGASRRRILTTVLTRVAMLLAAGATLGLVLAWAARKLIGVVIYLDFGRQGGQMLLVAAGLMLAGMAAALIPARRAATIDPMQALRNE